MKNYFVTGTGTDVGKTVVAAWCMLHLDADYWKPINSGLEPRTDGETVKLITGFDQDRFLPEPYLLSQPLSAHEAAKRDGVHISLESLSLPQTSRSLIVEGAGGVLVPLNEKDMIIDLMAQFSLPVIVVCKSTLGTINHTLLTLEALRTRGIEIKGVIINGPKAPHNREAIEEYGQVPVIAEIDQLVDVTKEELLKIKPEIEL